MPGILVLCFVIFVLFLVGPRVPIDQRILRFEIPEDPETYLRAKESRFPDLRPDAKKTIIWADPVRKHTTPVAVVYLHGFSSCRQETAPLSNLVAQELRANLFYTRLTGHGRTSEAMGEATVNDWLNDAVEALEIGRRIGEKVIIIATSTGATLATWLATYEISEDVLAYVLISPNYLPADAKARLLTFPWAKYVIPLIFGKIWYWTPVNDRHGQYWTRDYPMTANMTLMGLVNLVRKCDVSVIRQPALVFYSSQDKIVKSAETIRFFEQFGSPLKKKIAIEDSQDPRHHVIAGDILSPNTTECIASDILDFVKSLPNLS